MKPLLALAIERPEDVFALRQSGRAAAAAIGCDESQQVRFATALSELAREALAHRSGAVAEYHLQDGVLSVRIERFPRAGTLGESGFQAAQRLFGKLATVDDAPGDTVTVSLEPGRPAHAAKAQPSAIREAVRGAIPLQPLEELRLENRDLIATLRELQAQKEQLVELNAELEETNRGVMAMYAQLAGELEETNRGVVALYAELDEKSARLNEANQAKSRFLASVSHELRSPVNSILGLTSVLLDTDAETVSDEQRRQIDLVRGSASELLKLVNGLLDLAKAESGRLQPEIERVELPAIFSELRGSLRPLARSGVDLQFDVPDDAWMETDPLLLTQVVRNLVSNALKFTESGSVRLSVAFPSAYEIEIAVADTGIGISPEDQPKVFEEFYQVRGRLQADRKGTGLGLPYAQRVTKALGGNLSLQSEPGEGSTFTLRFPVQWQALLHAAASPQNGASENISVAGVVIADDDEGFRTVLRGLLQGIAGQVKEARGGVEALELIRSERPDIAFIDLRMPDIGGDEVLARMKAEPELREIPAIIVTSTELNDENRATLGHAAALMSKAEVTPDRLRSVIRRAFERAGAVK